MTEPPDPDMGPICDIYDMPVASCSHCHHKNKPPINREIRTRFKARYDGRGACGHSIYEGDPVGFNADDELLCEQCTNP